MSEKKISPREAAVAVLKKAEELYKSSTLAKGDWAKIHSKLKREGYSEESADKIDGAIKAKMNKGEMKKDAPMAPPSPSPSPGAVVPGSISSKIGFPFGKSDENGANPDEKADAALGEKVEQDVQQHEENNEDPAHADKPMKGHIKLAKFIGAMEQKRGTRAK